MKKFKVTTDSRVVVIEGDTLDLDKVLLLVASTYGEEWYGCCVQEEGTHNFYCNAVKEYFTDSSPDVSVYEWAVRSYCSAMRLGDKLLHKEVYDPYEGETTYYAGYNLFTECNPSTEVEDEIS